MQKLQVFAVHQNGNFRLGLLRNPYHLGYLTPKSCGARILSTPLASTAGYTQLEIWEQRLQSKFARLWWSYINFAKPSLSPKIYGELKDLESISDTILTQLEGRLLRESDLLKNLRQQGYWPGDVSIALDLQVYHGKLLQFPSFQRKSWGSLVCTRCESDKYTTGPCLQCGSVECITCLECSSLGNNRGCDTFLTAAFPAKPVQVNEKVSMQLKFAFTAAQQLAASELLNFGQGNYQKALVWAACGAGKTEVTFPLIEQVLNEGHDVLFAIPRQDIVREMAQRLGEAFPQTTIAIHYGGKPRLAKGRLVVATTHQVLNFSGRFRLVILDEVDAFPYQGSKMLRFGLQRALHSQGKIVEMTATPQNFRDYDQIITIPARYHGWPLPVPEFFIHPLPHWNQLTEFNLPPELRELLQSKAHPWLIFAPTIAACEKVQVVLSKALGDEVGLCHSRVQNRIETIGHLQNGTLTYVVSTSVLERGVNFAGVGVVVLYGEHPIFTANTLIQMAGRVGRSILSPTGTVLFVSSKITKEMKRAKELIWQLNQVAAEKGLLNRGD